jgi:hypothetical protein
MIRFLARTIGLWLIAGGFAAAVVDGMKSIAASRPILTFVGGFWAELAPASLLSARALVEARLGGRVWAAAIDPVLANVPVFAAAALVGALFVTLGRPPRAKIGVEP